MQAFISYVYEETEINHWLRLNYQCNEFGTYVDLKLPYTPIELISALNLLADKIRMKIK